LGVQEAIRKGKRGRAKGGMIMGVRKELLEEEKGINAGIESVIVGNIKHEKERWKIIGVYVDEGIESMAKKVESWIDRTRENYKTIIGGSFNAKIGRERGGVEGENGEKRERRAKDETLNGEDKKLLEWVEENGWGIFNGCIKGDKEGEFTFTRKREFNN